MSIDAQRMTINTEIMSIDIVHQMDQYLKEKEANRMITRTCWKAG